jgi:hypothetical protein
MAISHVRSPSQEKVAKNSFTLDYEENVAIAEVSTMPKVQKFHKEREWYDLWMTGFDWVKVWTFQQLVCAVCRKPKPVDPVKLRAALEFEFDLPYPDSSRIGLVDEAIAAFSARLGVKL